MPRKSKATVVRSDSADASIEAAEEVVRELALRGNIAEAVEVIETMEEVRPLSMPDVYPSDRDEDEDASQ